VDIKPILFILGALSVNLLIGCSPNSATSDGDSSVEAYLLESESSPSPAKGPTEPRAGGTSDPGGGGEIKLSTPEEVIQEIERSRDYLLSAKGQIFLTRYLPASLPGKSAEAEKLKAAFEAIVSPGIESYLAKSKIVYLKTDTAELNCARGDYAKYPDAYVSAFEYGAEICFNVQRLTRLTKDSLFRHLTKLWMHELAHLSGFEEDLAEAIGEATLQAFAQSPGGNSEPTLASMWTMAYQAYVDFALAFAKDEVDTDRLNAVSLHLNSLTRLSEFVVSLDKVHSTNDEIPDLTGLSLDYLKAVRSAQTELVQLHAAPTRDAEKLRPLDVRLACVSRAVYRLLEAFKYETPKPDYSKIPAGAIHEMESLKCD
jgi:hypothetical protein